MAKAKVPADHDKALKCVVEVLGKLHLTEEARPAYQALCEAMGEPVEEDDGQDA